MTRAAAICDPDGADAAVRGLMHSFEDGDPPPHVAEWLAQRGVG